MKITLKKFKQLIEDNDFSYLDELAFEARLITEKYFGKNIDIYIPVYISNFCTNDCIYCNFSINNNKIKRQRLTLNEIEKEFIILKNKGFKEILILSGGDEKDFELVLNSVLRAKKYFDKIGIEIFSCSLEQYKKLKAAGVAYVTIYQECYNKKIYNSIHRSGNKSNYYFRYNSPARVLKAGIRGIGMGVLYGISDPISETIALAEHISYLRKIYWDRDFSISFPRIRDRKTDYYIPDKLLAKIIFLFRLLFNDITLNLSTRESSKFRDGMLGLGINKISAESSTKVGGYLKKQSGQDQFLISDTRNLKAIKQTLKNKGYFPVLKDYSAVFN